MFRSDMFEGKRFLVTGGGTGLGRIMMERFVELGADCVICGRRGSVLEETARQGMAKHPGRRVETHTAEIRGAAAVEGRNERIWATAPPHRIVNDAPGNHTRPTAQLPPRSPLGRVGRPSELANMAAFLMSDEVEYINGEVIAIDGGMGIMGNGTFSNMMAYSDDDWRRIREHIQSTNQADRAKRS